MKKQNLSRDKHTYFSSLSEQELKNLLITDFQSVDGEILTAEDIDMILGIIFLAFLLLLASKYLPYQIKDCLFDNYRQSFIVCQKFSLGSCTGRCKRF